jgi:hypothetical protein
MGPAVLAGEQLDPGPAGAGSCFRLGLAVRSRLLPEYTTDDHPGLDGRTILIMYAQRLDPPTLQLPASRYRGVTVYARARWPGRARHRGWFTGAVVAAGIACCRGHVVAGFGRYWARPGFCET